MFSFKRPFTFYLYDSVNGKNKLSFKFLRTVNFYAILKICNFEKKKITDFEKCENKLR